MDKETRKIELTKDELFLLFYALHCLKEEYKHDLEFSRKIEENSDNVRYWKARIAEIDALEPKVS